MVQLYPPYQLDDDTDSDSNSEWSSSDEEEEEHDELSKRRRDKREDLLLEPPEQFADVYDALQNNVTDNYCYCRNHIYTNHCSATDCEFGKSARFSFESFNDFINDLSRTINLHSFIFNTIVLKKMQELFGLIEKSYSTAKSNELHHQTVTFGNTRRLKVRENSNLRKTATECESVVKNDSDKQMMQATNSSCSYTSSNSLQSKEVTEEIIVKKVAPKGLSATPFNYVQTPEEDPSDGYDYVFCERSINRGWTNTDNQSVVDDCNVCNIPQMNVLDASQRNVSEEATGPTRGW